VNGVVLDTTIVSFAFKANDLFDLYRADLRNSVRYVSFQTVAEMRYCSLHDNWGPERRQRLEEFLATLHVVGYTDELGMRWAEAMNHASTVGRRLEAGDAWIAATALLLNIPLLTHDRDLAVGAMPSLSVICHLP
jgi:predicted nucleic acid-binding protein